MILAITISLIFAYLFFGTANTVVKRWAVNDYYPVNKHNWWKSVLLWPVEMFYITTQQHDKIF